MQKVAGACSVCGYPMIVRVGEEITCPYCGVWHIGEELSQGVAPFPLLVPLLIAGFLILAARKSGRR